MLCLAPVTPPRISSFQFIQSIPLPSMPIVPCHGRHESMPDVERDVVNVDGKKGPFHANRSIRIFQRPRARAVQTPRQHCRHDDADHDLTNVRTIQNDLPCRCCNVAAAAINRSCPKGGRGKGNGSFNCTDKTRRRSCSPRRGETGRTACGGSGDAA